MSRQASERCRSSNTLGGGVAAPTSRLASGFSLLEVLITAFVVALAMAPLLLSINTSTRTVTGTREYLSAVAFAQLTLEDLRRGSFRPTQAAQPSGGASPGGGTPLASLDEMVTAMNVPDRIDPLTGRGSQLVENNVKYARSVRLVPALAEIIQGGLPDVRLCQVTVTWKPVNAGVFHGEQTYQVFSLFGSADR